MTPEFLLVVMFAGGAYFFGRFIGIVLNTIEAKGRRSAGALRSRTGREGSPMIPRALRGLRGGVDHEAKTLTPELDGERVRGPYLVGITPMRRIDPKNGE